MKHLAFIIFLLFVLPRISVGQFWTGQLLNRSQGWIRLNQQTIRSDLYFNAAPNSMAEGIRTNSYFITSLTGEYGISTRITAIISVPFVRVTINELKFNQSGNSVAGGSLNTFGDADIGLQWSIRKKLPIQVAAFFRAGLGSHLFSGE